MKETTVTAHAPNASHFATSNHEVNREPIAPTIAPSPGSCPAVVTIHLS